MYVTLGWDIHSWTLRWGFGAIEAKLPSSQGIASGTYFDLSDADTCKLQVHCPPYLKVRPLNQIGYWTGRTRFEKEKKILQGVNVCFGPWSTSRDSGRPFFIPLL